MTQAMSITSDVKKLAQLMQDAQQTLQDHVLALYASEVLANQLSALEAAYKKSREEVCAARLRHEETCHMIDTAMQAVGCTCHFPSNPTVFLDRYILRQHGDGALDVRSPAVSCQDFETGERFTYDPTNDSFFLGDVWPGYYYLEDVPEPFLEKARTAALEKALQAKPSSPRPRHP